MTCMRGLYPPFQCYNPLVANSGRLSIFFGLIGVILLLLPACQAALPTETATAAPPTVPVTPAIPSPTATLAATSTPRPTPTFAPPSLTAVTAIPEPVTSIQRPDEVQVLVLVLNQRSAPFVGLSQAVLVVIYHPRLGRASVLALPPDLMVYLPGYTMQRLQAAQPVGGIRLLNTTLAYALGVWPDYWLQFDPNSLTALINDLGGLDLNILRDYPNHCGGIPGGPVFMTGEQVQCLIAFRDGTDEDDRGIRLLEVFRQVVQRLANDGRLSNLEYFYKAYWSSPNSNIGLKEWTESIPLILKLADPNRIGFFSLFDNDRILWRLPGEVEAYVLLPQPDVLAERVQAALDYVLTPMPLSEFYATREAALTTTPTGMPTMAGFFTATPTLGVGMPSTTPNPNQTGTPTITGTIGLGGTVTATTIRTSTSTPTPSETPTPTSLYTSTPSVTPQGYPLETYTPQPTSTPYP